MTYQETIEMLFDLLFQANLACSDQAQEWQWPGDAAINGAYGSIRQAIIDIAGEKIVDRWAETGEIDLYLADRWEV